MRAKLTSTERLAVKRFLNAAKKLPQSLYIRFDRAQGEEPAELSVYKRIGKGEGLLADYVSSYTFDF